MSQKDAVLYHFDADSKTWDEIYRVQRPWRGKDQNFLSRLFHVKNLIQDSEGDLLDVGCGAGVVTIALYHSGIHSIHGIDFSPKMVELAKQNALSAKLPVPVDISVADAESTGFPSESFDIITAVGVLEYADRPVSLMAELARLARPEATIIITTPNRLGINWNWDVKVVQSIRKAARPVATLIKYKLRGRQRPPTSNWEQVTHKTYTPREMAVLAESVGLKLDSYLYCTFCSDSLETVLPVGGPISRVMDRFANRTWLSWPASNLIVRLMKPK